MGDAANADDLDRDVVQILGSGINNTGRVMEILKEKGWSAGVIVRVVYQLLLRGKIDPNGNQMPYKAN
jgi:hypothetical protein